MVAIRRGGRCFSFLDSSGAPTNLNSDQGEKLRNAEWLISAILREMNQLASFQVRLMSVIMVCLKMLFTRV